MRLKYPELEKQHAYFEVNQRSNTVLPVFRNLGSLKKIGSMNR